MSGTLTLDFTKFSKVKSSYDLKGKDMLSIVTGGDGGFIDGVKSVSASGSTLSVTLQIYVNQKLTTKKIKFTNVNPDMNIRAMKTTDPSTIHWGGDETTVSDFYFNPKFANADRTWLSKPSATSVKGTVFGEEMDLSDEYVPTSKNLKKNVGVTINGGKGNDTITGTRYNDKITGGAGNDLIYATAGNDTITGSSGENEIKYAYKKAPTEENPQAIFGKDTIKLTKGETLNLNIKYDDDSNVGLTYGHGKGKNANDLIITNGANENDSIIIKDYYGKTTGATVKVNGVNLANIAKIHFDKNDISKASITGSALADTIDVSEADQQYKTVKKKKVATELVVDAGAGNDNITGSNYNDIIKGGAGNDSLTGGKGNDTLTGGAGSDTFIFNADDGVDTITDASKDDHILINNLFSLNAKYTRNGDNLEIYRNSNYDQNNKIIVKDYFKTKEANRLKNVQFQWGPQITDVDLSAQNITTFTGSGTITANNEDNLVIGSAKADTIKALAGDDEIRGNGGNDKLYGGKGNNKFVFSAGDGVDTVYSDGGNDTLQFNDFDSVDALKAGITLSSNGKNLRLNYSDSDAVVIDKFYKNKTNSLKAVADKNGNAISIDELFSSVTNTVTGKGDFVGTPWDDKFISTSANETFTGKGGENTIVFSGKFGKDVVKLTEGENLVLDMSGYDDLFGGHVRRSISGNDLVIKAYSESNKLYGQITLKNFAKSNVTGPDGSVILRLPNEDIDLNKGEFDVLDVSSSYTGSRFNEYIDAWNAKKAITIAGGKGDDYITGSQHKPTTFAFSAGDGHDRLSNTKQGDIIQINSAGEVTYENEGGDLIIGYGNGDTIQVDGYFSAQEPTIDTIKIKNAQGKYETKSLATLTNLEEVQRTVLNVRINDGEIILPADTEYTTINFVGYHGFTEIYTYGPEYGWEGKNDDDLYMPYGNQGDTIIFKDFFKNNGAHNTRYISVGGQTYDLPRRYYLEAKDDIVAPATEDWLYMGGGDHRVTFTENNNFHNYDYIYSEGAQYTDNLVLNDYSFKNGEIGISRETGNNGSLVIHANDGKDDGRRNHILYRHYFDGDTPLVKIVDKNGTIAMDRTFATATRDWSTDAEKNNDHVLFVNNNSETEATTTTVISNTKANQIIVEAYTKEDAAAKLNYSYNGGNDVIDSGDYYANDTYNIATFTASSRLSVLDNGGYSDTVNINANSDDFYLLFDVENYISSEPNPDDWAIGLVHKDAMTVDTIKSYFAYDNYHQSENTVAGVLKFNGAGWGNADEESEEWDTSDYGGTIEYIRTNDNNDRLDIAGWKKYVAGRVRNWLENNNSVEGKNLKFYYGSPVSVMKAVADGKITLTEAQYQSLLDCYKVKYSELPKSGNFVSTTGNDTYNLEEANNTITFNNTVIGNDTINSNKEEYNASYKDRIIFTEDTGYSVKNGTLGVGVNDDDLVISADLSNMVTYTNFVSDIAHNDVILTDASNDKYNLSVVTTGSNFKEGSNNIAFVYNDNVSNSVGTTTGINFIYSYGEKEYNDDYEGEDIKGMWNCVYRGGTDTVISYSENGSDGYEVWEFNKNSKLYVSDSGGAKDSLLWGDDNRDVSYLNGARFVFNVDSEGSIVYDDALMFVHKEALTGATLNSAVQNDLTAGVLKYDMATSGDSFGLEKVTNNNYNPETRQRESIDIIGWANEIKGDVQAWLTANDGFTSAYDAFENCNDATALGQLVACYNVDYSTIGQA